MGLFSEKKTRKQTFRSSRRKLKTFFFGKVEKVCPQHPENMPGLISIN